MVLVNYLAYLPLKSIIQVFPPDTTIIIMINDFSEYHCSCFALGIIGHSIIRLYVPVVYVNNLIEIFRVFFIKT